MNRLLLSSLLLGALGGVAFADDQPADPAAPAGGAADPAAGTAPAGAPPAAAEAPAARWPKGVIDRPLTLPAGLGLAGADFFVFNTQTVTVTGTGVTTSSATGTSVDIALGYGITDDLEVNTLTPTYNIITSPDGSAKGPLDVGVGYKLLRGALDGKLEVIARAVIGVQFGDSTTVRPLRLGVQAQYNATPKIAILSHDTGFGNLGINIGLDGDVKPVFLTIPVGVAYQATPELWIEADTSLVPSIKISDSSNTTIGDFTPLAVTGIYNTMQGHLDLLGYVGFGDLQNAGDTWSVGVGFRYYPGKV